MNENITKEQRRELIEDSHYNYIVMDEDFSPVCQDNGDPVIYGGIENIGEDNFQEGSDTAIISVAQYCKLFNRRVEDVMEYNA